MSNVGLKVSGLAILGISLAWTASNCASHGVDARPASPVPTDTATEDAPAPTESEGSAPIFSRDAVVAETASDAPVIPEFVSIVGRVLSSETGAPVPRAELTVGDERAVLANPSGSFRETFRLNTARTATVGAPNHHPKDIPLTGAVHGVLDVGDVRLAPSQYLECRVETADGTPAHGASVSQISTRGTGRDSNVEVELGSTDEKGLLKLALTSGQVVRAILKDAVSVPRQIRPGQRSVVLTLLPGTKVGVMNSESSTPLGGVRVRLSRTNDHPWTAHELVSETDGYLPGVLADGEYEVELVGWGHTLTGGATTAYRTGKEVHLIEAGAVSPLWIRVSESTASVLRLVDAETGEPTGPAIAWVASFEEPPFVETPGWVKLGGEREYPSNEIDLRSLGLESLGGEIAVFCRAAGFKEASVHRSTLDLTQAINMPVALKRAKTGAIRVVDPSGTPFRHPLVAQSENSDRTLFQGTPNAEGMLGPLPETGEPIAFYLSSHPKAQHVGTLAHPLFEREEIPTLVVRGLGRIAVRGLMEGTGYLACTDGKGFQCVGRESHGWTVFEHLPPGSYEVGTPLQLRSLSLRLARGLPALPIELQESSTVEVEWEPHWRFVTDFHDRVIANGVDPALLHVIPLSAPVDLPAVAGYRRERFPVQDDGAFDMPGLEGTPTQYVFVRRLVGGSLMPVGVSWPDRPTPVECSPVSVDLSVWPTTRQVSIAFSPRIPGIQTLDRIQIKAKGGEVVDLGPLPIATSEISIIDGDRSHRIPVTLEAGVHFVVAVPE